MLHVRHDSAGIARRARQGLQAKLEREALAIDPRLSAEALAAKVGLLRRVHMLRMARASAKARREKATRIH